MEARRRGARPDTAELGPDELAPVRLFFTLISHWRVHPATGVRLGLDYAAVQPTAAMLGLTMSPDLFDDLRVMEGAALTAWAAA